VYQQVAQNKRRSALIIGGFVVFVVLVVTAFDYVLGGGGVFGLAVALPLAAVTAFASYWKSDAIALAMSRARPADPVEYARLHNLVEGLCIAGGLPKPRLYVVEDPAPNAFATGRNPEHAAVAVTTGLLEKMNRVELEGVLAHELSHVKNYDILVSTIAVTMVGVVAILADIGVRMLWFGGGRRPYGYAGLGELVAFVFFGLVATVGTTYVQIVAAPLDAWLAGVIAGLFAAAVLLVNNIRDRGQDALAGKRSLAVRLGDRPARILFAVLIVGAYGVLAWFAAIYVWAPYVYFTLLIGAPVIIIVLLARTAAELVLALKLTSLAALLTGLALAAAIAF